jgi:LysR family glycine cleavage system transcriptional activator
VSAESDSRGKALSIQAPSRPHLPPLKALLGFESAARHGSFIQAAEELCVTPSAVSHQIQSLESFLRLQLFTRRGGRVTLTSAGQRYYREIDNALRAIADATATLAPRPCEEMLTIVASPSFAVKWLQPRLPAFLAACPDARIRVSTCSADAPIEAAIFDIAITYGRPERADLATLPLLYERLTPMCSPALAQALDLRTIADLRRGTLIHSANLIGWKQFFAGSNTPELRPLNELWIDRSAMAISAAVDSLGIVLESDVLTQTERIHRTLVAPFAAPEAEITSVGHYLAIGRTARSGRNAALFIQWLADTIPTANRAWAGDLVDSVTERLGDVSPADRSGAPSQSRAQKPSAALLNTAGRSS